MTRDREFLCHAYNNRWYVQAGQSANYYVP